ncbi:hypothetical protein [Thermomonospora umbrina]|nr:hypothetical protein [Thermomonospora umbrina]
MGYSFNSEGNGSGFDIPGHEMVDVREVLRLGVMRAGERCPVEMHKFESNGGWHVGPEECRELARILDGREGEMLVADYRSFVDDVADNLIENVHRLAAFSAEAADRGGFRVT